VQTPTHLPWAVLVPKSSRGDLLDFTESQKAVWGTWARAVGLINACRLRSIMKWQKERAAAQRQSASQQRPSARMPMMHLASTTTTNGRAAIHQYQEDAQHVKRAVMISIGMIFHKAKHEGI